MRKTERKLGKVAAKEPMKLLSVRLDKAEREALEQAAAADDRPAAVLLRRICERVAQSRGMAQMRILAPFIMLALVALVVNIRS